MKKKLNCISEIIEDAKKGNPFILVDNEDRENEGDIVFLADFTTPELINFMITKARGLVCLAISSRIAKKLDLTLMNPNNDSKFGTAFTQSIEAKQGVSTGISTFDRSQTILTAISEKSTRADIAVPGHIFPIIARDGGVLERPGHTEASVEIAKICKSTPAAVICEILNPDGSMSRLSDLLIFAERFKIKIASIQDLILYVKKNEYR